MLRITLFGAGRIGSIHGSNAANHPEIELVSVVDPVPEAAHKLAARLGCAVSSVDEALSDQSIDAVIIATSTHTHTELSLRAMDAGKAVFCEKPIDLDLDRARTVARRAQQSEQVYMVGFSRRFDPEFMAVKQGLAEIGQIEQLLIVSRDPAPPPREYIEVSGGLFRDMTIHDFDMARWLLQEPIVRVQATATNFVSEEIRAAGDVDTATIQLSAASGAQCSILNSRRAVYGYDQRVEVFGAKGMLQAHNLPERHVSAWNASGCHRGRLEDFFLQRYEAAYRIELDEFVRCVAGEQPVSASAADGVAALELADVACRSLQQSAALDCDIR